VVGEHDHVGSRFTIRGAKRVENTANLLVGECDLSVVRTSGETALERLGRIVRRVRIVEMKPGKERSRRVLDPSNRDVRHFVRAALGALFARTAFVKLLVERIEPLSEAECCGDRVGADERGGVVTEPLQPRGDRRISRSEREHDVAPDAVRRWIFTGQDGCV